jgi:DNA recombination protein RmuC
MEYALAIAAVLAAVALLLWRGRAEAEKRARDLQARLDLAEAGRQAAEIERAKAVQQVTDLKDGIANAETVRQELLTATKAATTEAANLLSSKLIDDHKRETEAAKKESQDSARLMAENLTKQYDEITKVVAALSGQVQEKGRLVDTVWHSLTSPGGAGQIAEIGLGNTLKGFGLEEGRDYVLQFATADEITGDRLRPDAVIYLPGNSAIVIDCKASKYLVEIAAAEGSAAEAAAYASLAATMNRHLKQLADKNYRGAVQTAWRAGGRGDEIARIHSVMYLPNDGALEKVARADPRFPQKAREAQIIPAGPAGLHCLLSVAAVEINGQRQADNQQRIIDLTRDLLDSVGVALGYAASVGRGIRTAAEGFAKFSNSVNTRLLQRARKLGAVGVEPTGKKLPPNLPAFAVTSQDADQIIEGESSEVSESEPPARRLLAE